MLVEHDPLQCEAARNALGGCGAEFVFANDIEHAFALLNQLETELPELILLHPGPRDGNIADAIFKIRSEKRTRFIPVMVLANSIREKEMLEQYRFPLCACSVVPLTLTKLIYALPALDMKINDSILYSNHQPESELHLAAH